MSFWLKQQYKFYLKHGTLSQGHLQIISVYYACSSIYIVATAEITKNIAITMFLMEQN